VLAFRPSADTPCLVHSRAETLRPTAATRSVPFRPRAFPTPRRFAPETRLRAYCSPLPAGVHCASAGPPRLASQAGTPRAHSATPTKSNSPAGIHRGSGPTRCGARPAQARPRTPRGRRWRILRCRVWQQIRVTIESLRTATPAGRPKASDPHGHDPLHQLQELPKEHSSPRSGRLPRHSGCLLMHAVDDPGRLGARALVCVLPLPTKRPKMLRLPVPHPRLQDLPREPPSPGTTHSRPRTAPAHQWAPDRLRQP
jgi:hypothetical protein